MKQMNEGVVSRTADIFYAFKFLKTLVTPWEKTKAFELGLIDDNGKVLKKPKTPEEKDSYTVFNRLVFNIKRLMNKLPFGKMKLATYATALFLIKEHTGMAESKIKAIMEEATGQDFNESYFNENKWFETDTGLNIGTYTLTEDILSPITGDIIALKNTKIRVDEKTSPHSTIFGKNIYKVTHVLTKQKVYISTGDIER